MTTSSGVGINLRLGGLAAALVLMSVGLALAVGTLVASLSLSPRIWLLLAMAVAVVLPLLWRTLRGGIDPFEPLAPASAAFVVLFLLRPMYDTVRGDVSFVGFDVLPAYDTALTMALIAVAAFQLGYAVARRSRSAETEQRAVYQTRTIVLAATGLTLLASASVLASAALSGDISLVFRDRSAITIGTVNVPVIAAGAGFAVPAALLFLSVQGKGRLSALLASVVPVAVLLVAAIPKGDRRLILPLLVAAGCYYYLARGRRPSSRAIMVAILVAFFFVITPLRSARTGASTYPAELFAAVVDPVGAVESLVTAQDAAIVNALALEVSEVGDQRPISWQYGVSTLTETLLQPVPRQLWAEKPESIRLQLIEYNWGIVNGRCISQCPTFSVIGTLYADGGAVPIALGALLIGVFAGRWYVFFRSRATDPLIQAAHASVLFSFFVVWWSTLGTIVTDLAVYAVPILVTAALSRDRRQIGTGVGHDAAPNARVSTSEKEARAAPPQRGGP
jgi:hypothetical protein